LSFRKELLAHLIEYDYLLEKLSLLAIVAVAVALIVVIPSWPTAIVNYIVNSSIYGLASLGSPLVLTLLMAVSGYAEYTATYRVVQTKPRGPREKGKGRVERGILASSLLIALTIFAYTIIALTIAF